MKKLKIASSLMVLVTGCALLLSGCGSNRDAPVDANGNVTAEGFPQQAIEVVIPYSPGGITDLATRLVAQNMPKHLPEGNKGVVVINKPGGGGILAMSDIVASDPDGYTLGVMSNGVVSTIPLQEDVSYDFEDIDFLMHFYTMPSMVNVGLDSPYKTAEELIQFVKDNPGKLKLGLLGIGNAQHIAWLKLCKELNSSITVVPFKGTTDAITAVQQGMIDATQAYPMGDQKDGLTQLWTFATNGPKYFPGTKTIADLGYPTATSDMFFYFVAPKNIPTAIRDLLIKSINDTLVDPEVIKGMENLEIDAYYETGEWVEETLKTERETSKPFLEELGLLKEQAAK